VKSKTQKLLAQAKIFRLCGSKKRARCNRMTKEAEYRNFAAICLDLAKSSSTESDKAHLVAMAEAWHELAEQADNTTLPEGQVFLPRS
jgi:hypothetical protein